MYCTVEMAWEKVFTGEKMTKEDRIHLEKHDLGRAT